MLIYTWPAIQSDGQEVDSAKVLYEQGADAEARQNYELAYDCYKQAFNLKPKDLRYRARL